MKNFILKKSFLYNSSSSSHFFKFRPIKKTQILLFNNRHLFKCYNENDILMKRTDFEQEIESPNKPEEPSYDYTPHDWYSFSKEPEDTCRHVAEITANASIDKCYNLWSDWSSLVDFLDLIGEMAIERYKKSAAIFLYYKYKMCPVLQIMIYLTVVSKKKNEYIKFESRLGMPLKGIVEFKKLSKNKTHISLRIEHLLPDVIVEANIGTFAIETHILDILNQNLQTFDLLAQGKLKPNPHKYDHDFFKSEMKRWEETLMNSGWVSKKDSEDDLNARGFTEDTYTDVGEEMDNYDGIRVQYVEDGEQENPPDLYDDYQEFCKRYNV